MGTVEDIRQIFKDFLAPELRAISSRLDALTQVMDARFNAVDAKFDLVDAKIESISKEIAHVRELLNLTRRVDKLESKQTAISQ